MDYNGLRYRPGRGGHVESYFWRANHPTEPKAFWLKATILSPTTGSAPVAEVWCCTFNLDGGQFTGQKTTHVLEDCTFGGDPMRITTAHSLFEFDTSGGTGSGMIPRHDGAVSWGLKWRAAAGSLGRPLSIFPFDRMVDGKLPKNKTVTPSPALVFDGSLTIGDVQHPIHGWWGMQGHNWGRFHAPEYAWGQCIFPGEDGPECWVEGFTARTRIAGMLTPRLSAVWVRRGQDEYRFNRIRDLWRHGVVLEYPRWVLNAKGPAGELDLEMVAKPDEVVCLGYYNPDGVLSYCLNSKLARATLAVRPAHGDPFQYTSEHGGALEFLTRELPHGLEVV
jgi:hypothetical protein